MRVFVLTETYKTFLDWCCMRHVNPRAAEFVADPTVLRGKMQPGDQLYDARTVAPVVPQERRVA